METEGVLGDFDVLGAFVHLWRTKFTGALRFERESYIKIFYFQEGVIVAATSNEPTDQVGEILRKNGKVTAEQLEKAVESSSPRTAGDALVAAAVISRKELLWALKMQLIEMVGSILRWDDGSYSLVENYLPKRTENVSFLTQHILLELVLRTADRPLVARLAAPEDVFRRRADREDDYKALDLSKDADALIGRLDGAMTAGDLAGSSKIDEFSVFKLVGALHLLGILETPRTATPEPEALPPSPAFEAALGEAPALELDTDVPAIDFGTPTQLSFEGGAELETAPPRLEEPAVPSLDFEPSSSGSIPTSPGFSFDSETPASIPMPQPEPEPAAEPSIPSAPSAVPEPPPVSIGASGAPPEAIPSRPIAIEAASDGFGSEDFGMEPVSGLPPASSGAGASPAAGEGEPSLESQLRHTFQESVEGGSTKRISGAGPKLDFESRSNWRENARKAKVRKIGIIVLAAVALLTVAAVLWIRHRRQLPDEPVVATTRPAPATAAATASSSASSVAATATSPATAGTMAPPIAVATSAVSTAAPTAANRPTPPPPAALVVATSPAPAPVVAVPPTGSRNVEKGREFLKRAKGEPAGRWTIKLQSVCAEDSVERAQAESTADFTVWFVLVEVNGKTCFRVFGGFFDSQAEARAALAKVPARFREPGNQPTPALIEKSLP